MTKKKLIVILMSIFMLLQISDFYISEVQAQFIHPICHCDFEIYIVGIGWVVAANTCGPGNCCACGVLRAVCTQCTTEQRCDSSCTAGWGSVKCI